MKFFKLVFISLCFSLQLLGLHSAQENEMLPALHEKNNDGKRMTMSERLTLLSKGLGLATLNGASLAGAGWLLTRLYQHFTFDYNGEYRQAYLVDGGMERAIYDGLAADLNNWKKGYGVVMLAAVFAVTGMTVYANYNYSFPAAWRFCKQAFK